jgi:hypothetical protein
MKDEFVRMWKEEAVACFRLLVQNSNEVTEENDD